MVKLDILSDPICPWCYIGKTLLFRALEQQPDHPFNIEWHPFQLNPDMPKEGMERCEYLELKFGGKEGAISVYSKIAEHAEAAGLNLDFGAIKRTPNTLDAHRLIHWSGLEGKQTPVVHKLFKAYFEDGKDIGETDILVEIAEQAEMDGALVRRLLGSDADADDIAARDRNGRAKGVTGVPCFIVANQHAIPGAQPAELWEKVISEVNEQLLANNE